jgi:hypothetical protein
MRRMLTILLFLAVAAALYLILPCGSPPFAQAGCCKERSSFSAPWRPNGLPFEACRRLNQERDRDDVLQPTGFVWWDTRC